VTSWRLLLETAKEDHIAATHGIAVTA
jgi:hypothetical protein